MLFTNLEYIPLRLLRRFVFRDRLLLRWGEWFPYYRTNVNQADPAPLVLAYEALLPKLESGRAILEIGVGATNSTGYELAARHPLAQITLLEPFIPLHHRADSEMLTLVAKRYQTSPTEIATRVRRITHLATEASRSFDLIISSSVLEHVSDPTALFCELDRVLTSAGEMLHRVDYRDHFFKYPFHFLQFPRTTWERWLNPGDLPRWRVYDHIDLFERAGYFVRLAEVQRNPEAYARIESSISSEFRRDDPLNAVTLASLHVQRRT